MAKPIQYCKVKKKLIKNFNIYIYIPKKKKKESLKSTFPKMYSQEILVSVPSVRALTPRFRSGESGGIFSIPGTLGLGSPHTGSWQQLPQTSQAIPALGRQDLVVSLHSHTTACFPEFTAFFSFLSNFHNAIP